MKPSPLLWILPLIFASMQPQVCAATSADAAWKKLQYAMSYVEPEKFEDLRDAQRQERARVGLRRFDAALQEFAAAAPNDPRLWEAKVFDAVHLSFYREGAGYPAPAEEELMKLAEEVLKAPDATTAAKAMASGYKLTQLVRDTRDGTFPRDEWMRMAETHLKDYPGKSKHNELIKSWQQGMRNTMNLMALPPIDLKFAAIDGTEVDLAKLRGKVVLVYFWAVSSYSGNAQMEPIVRDTYQKHHAKGFEVIGIPVGGMNKSALINFLKRSPTPWPQIHDPPAVKDLATRYNPQYRSALHLFNKEGKLVQTQLRETLPEEVEKLLME